MNENTNIQEDEIDLKELFSTILKYKYKIIIFVFCTTFLSLLYVLSIPNSYKSEIILESQAGGTQVSGGLSSLASLAGVNLGGASAAKDPSIKMQSTLDDYYFNKYMIKKYDLANKLENPKNLVFALGIDSIYNLRNEDNEDEEKLSEDEIIYNISKELKKMISISSDKKTSLITLSVSSQDRYLAKELVDIYLEEIINKIKNSDMKEIDKQILYYKKELNDTYDVSLKEELSKSLSSLMQKKVFSLANDYYFVSKVNDSRIAYIKEKTKPKRALILIVSMITSLILAIFLVFFLEFLRNDEKK